MIDDINAVRNNYGRGKISQTNISYLCGTLAGNNPAYIYQQLGLSGDGKTVRTALSTEISRLALKTIIGCRE